MALTFFWRGENSLTLDGTHDYSAGATTVSAAQSATFEATSPIKVGSYSLDYPTNTDYHYLSTTSIWDTGANYENSFGFWFYPTAWTAGDKIFRFHESAAPNDYVSVEHLGTSGTGNLRLSMNEQGIGQTNVDLNDGDISLNAWYFVICRLDKGNTTARIELYDSSMTQLDFAENAAVTSSHMVTSINELFFGATDSGADPMFMDNIFIANTYAEPLEDNATITSYTNYSAGTSAAVTGTVTASIVEADIVAGAKTIILTLTDDTWIAAGTGPIGTTANTQAIIDGIDSAQAEAAGWDAVVKVGIDIADVVRTSSTVCTITLDAEATYNITAQETITATIPAAVLTTSTVDVIAAPTFTVDVDSVPAIDTWDTPVLDAEANNAFTVVDTTGNVTDAFISGVESVNQISIAASLTGSGLGPYSYDLPDIASYTVDTAGTALDSASHTHQLEVSTVVDGSLYATIVYNPKAEWAVVEVLGAVTIEGSVFFGWIGTPANTDQVYYPTTNNTSVSATGLLTTDQTTGTIDMVFFDTTDNSWKPFDIVMTSSSPPSGSRDTWGEIAIYLRTQGYSGTDNDVIMAWLESATSMTGQMNDLFLIYLKTLYPNANTLTDAFAQWRDD